MTATEVTSWLVSFSLCPVRSEVRLVRVQPEALLRLAGRPDPRPEGAGRQGRNAVWCADVGLAPRVERPRTQNQPPVQAAPALRDYSAFFGQDLKSSVVNDSNRPFGRGKRSARSPALGGHESHQCRSGFSALAPEGWLPGHPGHRTRVGRHSFRKAERLGENSGWLPRRCYRMQSGTERQLPELTDQPETKRCRTGSVSPSGWPGRHTLGSGKAGQ